jgi:hypothetical protein
MANAFARLLPDFEAPERRAPLLPPELKPLDAEPPAEDPAKLLAAAEERGRGAGFAAAEAAYERQRAEDLARFEERLVAARREWSETEADRLAGRFAAAFGELEATVIGSVARILVPFVAAAVRQQALDDLSETVSGLLAEDSHRFLRISGPEDLLAALRGRLSAHVASIEYLAGEGPDVRAVCDDTTLETQIRAWVDRLAAAAG